MSAEIPLALYKYLAPDLDRATQILGNFRIRFSQVSVLNDVDEFQPPYKGVAPREELEQMVQERFLALQPEVYSEVSKRHGADGAAQWLEQSAPEWAKGVEERFNNGTTLRELYKRLDDNFGTLSLSETLTSKLMWSFYSDGGRGFVIEFDARDAWFNHKIADNDSFRHLRQVQYVAEREPIYLASQADAAARDENVLYSKTHDWHFEKEWRIIRNFNEAIENVGPCRNHGKDILLFEIPPSAISAVIFGYRMSDQAKQALFTIVASNVNLKHIVFKQATHRLDGQIEIEPLDEHRQAIEDK